METNETTKTISLNSEALRVLDEIRASRKEYPIDNKIIDELVSYAVATLTPKQWEAGLMQVVSDDMKIDVALQNPKVRKMILDLLHGRKRSGRPRGVRRKADASEMTT